MDKLKIAFFTPTKEGTKSYYFSCNVLPYLSQFCDVDIFSDTLQGDEFLGLEQYHYLYAFKKDEEKNYDVFFYQIENHKDTNFCRVHSALKKGIILFHDSFFDITPPQAIVQYAYFGCSSSVKRECRNALFSFFTNCEDIKYGEKYTRNYIKTQYKNNVCFLNYPFCELENKKQNEEFPKKLKIFFKGGVKISSRYHKVLGALYDKKDVEFFWCTQKENFEQAERFCKQNKLHSYKILEDTFENAKTNLENCDVFINLKTGKERIDVFLIYQALMRGVYVISNKTDELKIFPQNAIFMIKEGEHEALAMKLFIEKIQSGEFNFDFDLLKEKFFLKLRGDEIAKELCYVFNNIKDEMKKYGEKEKASYEKAKEIVFKKAFSKFDSYLINERKELNLI